MDWTPVSPAAPSPSVLRGPARIFAVGDLHGGYDGFRTILRACGLIDGQDRWIGGDSQLVQLGDVFGRGGRPGRVLRLIRKLQAEAPRQGGQVHMLLGNHELLALQGCLLHNTREEFEDFADPRVRESFGDLDWEPEDLDPKARKRLRALGCWEFRVSLLPEGPVGRWLLQCPSVLVLDDTLFVHGGLGAEWGFRPPADINRRVREELAAGPASYTPLLEGGGPHWHRGYMLRRGDALARELERVLAYQGCRRMVVGHTPTRRLGDGAAGRVASLYGGALLCADTGISPRHGGHLSALRIENGRAAPVYPE